MGPADGAAFAEAVLRASRLALVTTSVAVNPTSRLTMSVRMVGNVRPLKTIELVDLGPGGVQVGGVGGGRDRGGGAGLSEFGADGGQGGPGRGRAAAGCVGGLVVGDGRGLLAPSTVIPGPPDGLRPSSPPTPSAVHDSNHVGHRRGYTSS